MVLLSFAQTVPPRLLLPAWHDYLSHERFFQMALPRLRALNCAPREVGRGVSELLSIPSSDLTERIWELEGEAEEEKEKDVEEEEA